MDKRDLDFEIKDYLQRKTRPQPLIRGLAGNGLGSVFVRPYWLPVTEAFTPVTEPDHRMYIWARIDSEGIPIIAMNVGRRTWVEGDEISLVPAQDATPMEYRVEGREAFPDGFITCDIVHQPVSGLCALVSVPISGNGSATIVGSGFPSAFGDGQTSTSSMLNGLFTADWHNIFAASGGLAPPGIPASSSDTILPIFQYARTKATLVAYNDFHEFPFSPIGLVISGQFINAVTGAPITSVFNVATTGPSFPQFSGWIGVPPEGMYIYFTYNVQHFGSISIQITAEAFTNDNSVIASNQGEPVACNIIPAPFM